MDPLSTDDASRSDAGTIVQRKDLGRRVLGAGAAALGLVGLAWGDFATVWQPVQEYTPARTLLAYLTALILLGGGLALQWRRSAGFACLLLAALFTAFAMLWMPRIIGYPHIFAVWAGFAEQFAVALAAVIAFAALREPPSPARRRLARAARIGFGICAVSFGFNHFFAIPQTAAMVPAWIPPGQVFWAWATGGAMVLAGLAILTGVQALLAARLLTALFLVIELFVWAPMPLSAPGDHMAWAGNAVTLTEIGAAWIVADFLARSKRRTANERARAAP